MINQTLPVREEPLTDGNVDRETADSNTVHILHSTLGLTVAKAEAERIEKDQQNRLLASRRLSLVVDLDQTILHATTDRAIQSIATDRDDIYQIFLPETPHQPYFIKLRPHLWEFLNNISQLFELHVYTMGSRSYARAVVSLFDPDGRLFYDRILSRDDSGIIGDRRKNLKRIFPADDSAVLVIDDRADVWDYSRNLIPVSPYTFFIGIGDFNRAKEKVNFLLNGDSNAAGIEGHTESIVVSDDDQELLFISQILESVHAQFFTRLAHSGTADVKTIVDERRRAVLSGASLVFSGLIPLGISMHNFELWRLALAFGADCTQSITPETTHVISIRNDTDKVLQAVERGIRVVKPDWLIGCFKKWTLLPAEDFLIHDLPSPKTSDEFTGDYADDGVDPIHLRMIEAELAAAEEEEESDEGDEENEQADGEEKRSTVESEWRAFDSETRSADESGGARASDSGVESFADLEAELDRELDLISELGADRTSTPEGSTSQQSVNDDISKPRPRKRARSDRAQENNSLNSFES